MATNTAMLSIRKALPSLSATERRIAKFITENTKEASVMTISELAARLGVADSTVFKFTRKLGYRGYRDFRNDLLSEAFDPLVSVHEDITPDASMEVIASEVFQSTIKSLQETRALFDAGQLDRALDILLSSKRVSFFGSGAANAVAYDAFHKFLRSPMPCQYVADYHMQLSQAALLAGGDCAFVITHTGLTEGMVEVARVAKEAGARVILITSHPIKPISTYADAILVSTSQEIGYRSETLSSRIAMLALLDSLYTAMMFKLPGVNESLHRTRQALSVTKLDGTKPYPTQGSVRS